jgi:ubiquitin
MIKVKFTSVPERYTLKLSEHAKAERARKQAEAAAQQKRTEDGRFTNPPAKQHK